MTNGSRFLLFLLGATALRVFTERQKNWDDQEWQVGKNLKEEVVLNSSDPGMIWNPANPQYWLRGGCWRRFTRGQLRLTIRGALDK